MTSLLPPRFLFRYSFAVRRIDRLPRSGKRLLNLPQSCTLPAVGQLDGSAQFAEVRCAWNIKGLGISITLTGRATPRRATADPAAPVDVARIWIDTRNTQSIHRASRYCHEFELQSTGGGADGSAAQVVQRTIARAREEAPLCDPDLIPVQSTQLADGYWLDAWIPAAALQGFDPVAHPFLGFFYMVQDAELGVQTLSAGREFPFASDPSLWSTLELTEE